MSDKFTQISDARAEFARLWDKTIEEIDQGDEVWISHWRAYAEAANRVLDLLGYREVVPSHHQGCLPSNHPDYLAYTLEELP